MDIIFQKKNVNENLLVWDPFEQYDPFRPNDYHEYKNWKQKEREQRWMQERKRVEELKRRRDSSRSEYSSDSQSEDGRPNRKAGRFNRALHIAFTKPLYSKIPFT